MESTAWNPFETLTEEQREQLRAFERMLLDFNRKLNLVSRETSAFFEERHVLHALALSVRPFPTGAVVVDWGTGGGLPAIPLAIRFPDVTFHAVDAVGKKIRAVATMARRLGLGNLHAWHGRAEDWPGRAHYSVSRATAPLVDLWRWHVAARDPDAPPRTEEAWPPGLICLKGGDLTGEIETLRAAFPSVGVETRPLEPLLGRPYFAEKQLVVVRS